MICIRVNLVSGSAHERFPPGTSVAALLFVQAQDVDAAEDIAGKKLAGHGWARMETERVKTVHDYAQFIGRDDVVGQAFREAQESGFGHVIYPESGA
jgi:hypothetical protein